MNNKKTTSFRKMIEKEAEPYWLSFGEMNAVIDSILETCADDVANMAFTKRNA